MDKKLLFNVSFYSSGVVSACIEAKLTNTADHKLCVKSSVCTEIPSALQTQHSTTDPDICSKEDTTTHAVELWLLTGSGGFWRQAPANL